MSKGGRIEGKGKQGKKKETAKQRCESKMRAREKGLGGESKTSKKNLKGKFCISLRKKI